MDGICACFRNSAVHRGILAALLHMLDAELARRALSRPIDAKRAQKLRDRLKDEDHARRVLEAIEAQSSTATREAIAQQLSQTRQRFRR